MTKVTNTKQSPEKTPVKKTKAALTKRKVTPVKKTKAAPNDDYASMSTDELVATLRARDVRIAQLEAQIPKKKEMDPEVVKEKVEKLRLRVKGGVRGKMTWKSNMSHGCDGTFSWSKVVEEDVFRAFMGYTDKDKKTKGKKVSLETFEEMLGCGVITKDIRYSTLYITSDTITISYGAGGTMKVSGCYGLPQKNSNDSSDW